MYVIFPAVDVVDESYLSLVSQENENPPPTGLRPSPRSTPLVGPPHPIAPPTYHDTRPEQQRAEVEIARQNEIARQTALANKPAEQLTLPVQGSSIPIPQLTQLQVRIYLSGVPQGF